MAKITIEELSGSLKEYLNGLGLTEVQVQELIDKFEDEKIGDISQLSTQEKGSLVGAINELFQNANNGKELIASAIGEPLSSEDTFSAMSNDINGLLSTFKTNMMNNGITVESGDKFKSLIDKIATLADNEGKGIQYAEVNLGTISLKEYGYGEVTKTYKYSELNVNFIPTTIFIHFPNYFILSSLRPNDMSINQTGQITSIDDNGFTIHLFNSASYAINITDITLYAIGVGEEDTTLRDSLASILQGEGVSVTENDDMASLIGKVDSEFDRQVVPAGNAVASNVLAGKTFINSTGSTITGTMANQGAKTFTPSASKQTGGAGYYSSVTCNAVANLSAANIKQGVVVGGVTGTCVPGYTLSSSPSYGDAIAGAMQSPAWCRRGSTILSYTSKFAGKVRVCIPLYKLSSSVYNTEKLTFMVNGTSKQVITLDTHLTGTSFSCSTVYSDLTINKGDVVTVKFDGSEYSGATIYCVGWFILCTFV